MDSRKLAVVHSESRIGWHGPFAQKLAEGLKAIGINHRITNERRRLDEGFPILLGTSLWRQIEVTGDFLLVDRCSFGDTNQWVSLVWNGHGRRGDHRIPAQVSGARWEKMGVVLHPWKQCGSRLVLCGQTETYSPRYSSLSEWYTEVQATHFRPHPNGDLLPGLPVVRDFNDCKLAITLNSSVGVEAVISGIPTITMDEGAMAWDVTGHTIKDIRMPDRLPWCHALAWTQWSHDEIREGKPIAHLFE
jgi:hypothetical protein